MDMSKYTAMFVSESQEHLQRMDELLLTLERTPDDAAGIAALFREAHSMKGMSASMGFEGVAQVAHRLEDFLDRCRQGRARIGGESLDLLFEGVDIIRLAVNEISQGGAPAVDVEPFLRKIMAPAAQASPKEPKGRSGLMAWMAEASPEIFARSGPIYGLLVDFSPDAPMPAARAYLTLVKLQQVGTVLASLPTLDKLQAGDFEGSLAVLFASGETPDALHRNISEWPDVAQVTLEPLEGGSLRPEPPSGLEPGSATVSVGRPSPGSGGVLWIQDGAGRPASPAEVPVPVGVGPETAPALAARPEVHPGPTGRGAALPSPALRVDQIVRVDTRLLDQLLDQVGELITAKGGLLEESRAQASPGLREVVHQVERLVGSLQRQALKLRMMPFEAIADRFPRAVRDLSRKSGKVLDFRQAGEDIELDRSILDHLGDPLIHLLRNAIDHGIEPPEERDRAGKPRTGSLTLRVAKEGESVYIQIEDDGRGMDPDHLRRVAVAKGLLLPEQAATLSDREALELVTRPGFSTAEQVTDVSGRGVGMDVVKTTLEGLHGSLLIESVPGRGTTFTLKLPMSLAVIAVLLVRVGGERYAIPMYQVGTTIEVPESAIQRAQGQEVAAWDGEFVPLLRLGRALGCAVHEGRPSAPLYAILTEVRGRAVGMLVDQIVGVQDVLVKPLGRALRGLRGFAGVTIMGDGSVVLILDVNGL